MASGEKLTLLSNASATGSAKTAQLGGAYFWSIVGTWAGATATLQYLGPDGTTWVDVTDNVGTVASLTANGGREVIVPQGSGVRVSITGSPSAMYSTLVRSPI